jgi:hypothetical protein
MKEANIENVLVVLLGFLLFFLVTCSCSTKIPQQVEFRTEVKTVERLVPVEIPADSSILALLLECDSTNKVTINELDELKTSNLNTSLTLSDNVLKYRVKTIRDTCYITIVDSFILEQKPLIVEVEKAKPYKEVIVRIFFVFCFLSFCVLCVFCFTKKNS